MLHRAVRGIPNPSPSPKPNPNQVCYIEPYAASTTLSNKRSIARRIGTTYALPLPLPLPEPLALPDPYPYPYPYPYP